MPGMERRRRIVGEINTLVKQWIRTEGMHQVRKFGVNAVQDHLWLCSLTFLHREWTGSKWRGLAGRW